MREPRSADWMMPRSGQCFHQQVMKHQAKPLRRRIRAAMFWVWGTKYYLKLAIYGSRGAAGGAGAKTLGTGKAYQLALNPDRGKLGKNLPDGSRTSPGHLGVTILLPYQYHIS